MGRPYDWEKLSPAFKPTVRSQRNITGNLTWTAPSQNTVLQKNLVLSVVENFAMDAYLHVEATAAASAAPAAASAALSEEAAAAEGGDPTEAGGPNLVLLKKQKRTFNIPQQVPAEYAIPIALRSDAEPVKGKWERMGGDVAVQGTWLAYYWAIQDGDVHAKEAIEQLVLNWPFDFYLFVEGEKDADDNLITNVDASIHSHEIHQPPPGGGALPRLLRHGRRQLVGRCSGSQGDGEIVGLGAGGHAGLEHSDPPLAHQPHVPLGDLPHADVAVGEGFVADR